jgi:rfaE bifunctional protein kinase chain/domain
MFETINPEQLFDDFTRLKILIIGDVMTDVYLWGKVRRISPEAPVPVVSDIFEERRLGGAANVALNIKAMGAVPILCSVIGQDMRSQVFLELLNGQNLSDIGIIVDKDRITTQKTRIISGNQHLLRVDEEIDHPVSKASEAKMIAFAANFIKQKKIDAIIFQDYDKGVVTPALIRKVTSLAREAGIPVLVDPKRRNFMEYKNATLFKPNFKELSEGTKAEISKSDLEGVALAMEKLRESKSHEMVMVTLSELGIMINDKDEYRHILAETREIADVSGAGDTVISIAALCAAVKMNAVDIAVLSNLAGGQVCERAGVVPVNREQLLREALSIQAEESGGNGFSVNGSGSVSGA